MQNVNQRQHGSSHSAAIRRRGMQPRAKRFAPAIEGFDHSRKRRLSRSRWSASDARLRTIPFVKASACGNDFLLIDAALAPADIAAFTRRICDRHDGVGADGVEWMSPHFSVDVEIRLINADGSPAEISGNGTRCVAAYVCATQGKERISILTGAGIKVCSLTGRRDSEYEFEIEMGKAAVSPELGLKTSSGDVRGIPVSMGNPHYVVFVPQFAETGRRKPQKFRACRNFPEGVNVEFVTIDSKHDLQCALFRARRRRNHVVRHRILRFRGRLPCHRPSRIARESPCPRRNANCSQGGRQHFLARSGRLVCRGEFFLADLLHVPHRAGTMPTSIRQLVKPPALRPGDTIGIVAPASNVNQGGPRSRLRRPAPRRISSRSISTRSSTAISTSPVPSIAAPANWKQCSSVTMSAPSSAPAADTARTICSSNSTSTRSRLNPKIFVGYSDITCLLTYFTRCRKPRHVSTAPWPPKTGRMKTAWISFVAVSVIGSRPVGCSA